MKVFITKILKLEEGKKTGDKSQCKLPEDRDSHDIRFFQFR